MTVDIGRTLQDARVRRGLSLRDAASRTKLSIAILRAIEENDFDRMPRGMYRKAYLRSFAAEVGVDPAAIAAAYEQQTAVAAEPAPDTPEIAIPEDELVKELTPASRPSAAALLTCVMMAAAWLTIADNPNPSQWIEAAAQGTLDTTDPLPVSGPVLVDAMSPYASASASSQFDGTLRVEVTATNWCWVHAESDGKRLIYRLFAPEERVVIEGRQQILLRLGDGAAANVSVNGGPSKVLGADGEVVELNVTPANDGELRQTVAARRAAPPAVRG